MADRIRQDQGPDRAFVVFGIGELVYGRSGLGGIAPAIPARHPAPVMGRHRLTGWTARKSWIACSRQP
jgi:hypothetical protein